MDLHDARAFRTKLSFSIGVRLAERGFVSYTLRYRYHLDPTIFIMTAMTRDQPCVARSRFRAFPLCHVHPWLS